MDFKKIEAALVAMSNAMVAIMGIMEDQKMIQLELLNELRKINEK